MLELRPSCECCDVDLPPSSPDAFICSFECTFCRNCARTKLHFRCANCNGDLVARPTRPSARLDKYPASATRIIKPGGCSVMAG